MSMNHNIDFNDEVDLKELLSSLWRGKIYITLFAAISVFLASLYLQNVERKYTVEYSLKPVGDTGEIPAMAGLGGIASLAGIQLPSKKNTDFMIFKELLTSLEVSKVIFENKELVKNVFKLEWNPSLNSYNSPQRSKIRTLFKDFKKLLTGYDVKYIPPNAKRLAIFIAENIQLSENSETGFLKILSETSDPDLMLTLIFEITETTDKIMRQRYIKFSTNPLAFYKDKLRTARSREHRESLASLIGAEEQKLMFASRGKYFIAEPYIDPIISLYPTKPKPILVLTLSLFIGLFIGIIVVIIRSVKAKDN